MFFFLHSENEDNLFLLSLKRYVVGEFFNIKL